MTSNILLAGGRRLIIVAAAGGALSGLALFGVTQLSGMSLFATLGALAAMTAAIGARALRPKAHLSEIKIVVPQFSELTFIVDDQARIVAWQLLIEITTRVSVQPLAPQEGLARDVLNSLYGVVATTREALKRHRPSLRPSSGRTVESLAIMMINHELRPFLTKWHTRLQQYETNQAKTFGEAWPDDGDFRAELGSVQANMITYIRGFGELAGIERLETLMQLPVDERTR